MSATRWQTAKKMPEGVTATMEDTRIKSLEFEVNGAKVRVSLGDYGLGLCVFTEAPPPTERKYRVTGSVVGLKVHEDFDDKFAADERARELASATLDRATVEVAEVDVPF